MAVDFADRDCTRSRLLDLATELWGGPRLPSDLETAVLLCELAEIARSEAGRLVRRERVMRRTHWSMVGAAFGISAQGAQKRFS
jgi:hypothetical protein